MTKVREPKPTAAKKPRDAKPLSITPATAARMLDMHYDTFRKKLMAADVFTVLRPDGRGIGKRCFVMTDEVELYGETRDELAVRNLRAEKGRLRGKAR